MSKPGALQQLLALGARSRGERNDQAEGRREWPDRLLALADLVFETDAEGCFTFVAPDPALGWTAATLLGEPSELLLLDGGSRGGLNPFRTFAPLRAGRAWVRARDGGAVCLSFAAVPLRDEAGRAAGAAGIGFDVTEDERAHEAAAAALRRLALFDETLWRLRQEVTAAGMIAAALAALAGALGADGAAIVRRPALGATLAGDAVRHHAGAFSDAELAAVLELMPQMGARPLVANADCREFLICPAFTRFRRPELLGLWRLAGKRRWDAADCELAGSAARIVRIVLEHEAIQQELFEQSRNDPLTGLFHREAFLEELARRIDRLEREDLPGTLMILEVDGLARLTRGAGPEAGDAALSALAALLRTTFRPADLLGRLAGGAFAAWLDGADDFAAAERAEALRVDGAAALARLADCRQTLSICMAIGTRWPGRGEEIDALMHRVNDVLREIRNSDRGGWRVSRPEQA